jgi:hypothetical protein
MACAALLMSTVTALPITARASSERSAKNSIFVEGLGAGVAYSVNYERLVLNDLGVRAGLSYMSFSASVGDVSASSSMLLIPLTANYIGISSGSHALEIGAGPTLFYGSGSASSMGINTEGSGMSALGTLALGYRLQPTDGGFQFRAGVNGLFGPGMSFSQTDPTSWGIIPWGYLSLGGTF